MAFADARSSPGSVPGKSSRSLARVAEGQPGDPQEAPQLTRGDAFPARGVTLLPGVSTRYLAQILVATVVGRGLLQKADAPPASMAPVLLVGLVFVAVSVNLPFVGGLLRFLVLVLGLGLALIGAHRGARRGVEV